MNKLVMLEIGTSDPNLQHDVLEAFGGLFPSWGGLEEAVGLLRGWASGDGGRKLEEILKKIEAEASFDGEWPGEFFFEGDDEILFTPFVGDRTLRVKRGGKSYYVEFTVDYTRRPSLHHKKRWLEAIEGIFEGEVPRIILGDLLVGEEVKALTAC